MNDDYWLLKITDDWLLLMTDYYWWLKITKNWRFLIPESYRELNFTADDHCWLKSSQYSQFNQSSYTASYMSILLKYRNRPLETLSSPSVSPSVGYSFRKVLILRSLVPLHSVNTCFTFSHRWLWENHECPILSRVSFTWSLLFSFTLLHGVGLLFTSPSLSLRVLHSPLHYVHIFSFSIL